MRQLARITEGSLRDRDLKAIQALKLLKLLSDTAPRRWTARQLNSHLGLHPRAVYRYLAELSRFVDIRRDGTFYQLSRAA